MTKKRTHALSDRCTTGVRGLDDVVGGGLPRNRLYLIRGDPGVGKTTVALQFLLQGAAEGETGLYITLSETKDELESVAHSHGWNLSHIQLFELSSIEEKLKREAESTFFHPSEVELNRTTETLLQEIDRVKPDRVVFDSLSEMRMLAETTLRYRRQVLHLKQFFSGRKCTVMFLDDRTAGVNDLQIESIAHGVLHLQRTSPEYGVARRQLNVMKIRGVKFREGFHDLLIEKGGVVVFPRLIAAEHHKEFQRQSVPSGIPELDSLLGGGLDRGTSTMFMGPPGTGKSTLALRFVTGAADRGERVLYFAFDETSSTLIGRSKQLGMPVEKHIKSGLMRVQQVDPAETTPGEFAHRIREAVEKENARFVVIDSLNGYLNAMPGERYLNLQLHELLAYLNQQGVVTIMILAQQGLVGVMSSAVDLTYLADTVVLLRYFEARGTVKQAVSVIKKRSGNHERTIREISTNQDGITVGEPLTNFHGVLSGIPTFTDHSNGTG